MKEEYPLYIRTEDECKLVSVDIANYMSFGTQEEVGQLSWTDGELKFEGNIHESAKIFFEYLKPYVDEYIKAQQDKQEG